MTATHRFTAGDRYRLRTDNARLHGREVRVMYATEYGAVVATGVGSGEYRAAADELVPLPPEPKNDAKEQGYTGNTCDRCGSSRMMRAGACETCLECGTAGGCG